MGLNKTGLVKVTLYEAISNLASSAIFGIFIGIIAAILLAEVILMTFELPFKYEVSI